MSKLRGACAAAITALVALSSAPAAFAGDNPNDCPSGSLCVWQGMNYTMGAVPGGSKMSQDNTSWQGWYIYDNDESWSNKSSGGNSVGVYALTNYAGWVERCIYPGTWMTRTTSDLGRTYNQGRSNRWKSGNGCYAAV